MNHEKQQQNEALEHIITWSMYSSWGKDWPAPQPTRRESGNKEKMGSIAALKNSLNGQWKKLQLERQESHGQAQVMLAGYAVGQWTT